MNAAAEGKHQADLTVFGYCVHCRVRRQMSGAIQVCNRRGGRDLKGHCSVCGKSMYRLGGWDSVAAAAQEAAKTSVQNKSQDTSQDILQDVEGEE